MAGKVFWCSDWGVFPVKWAAARVVYSFIGVAGTVGTLVERCLAWLFATSCVLLSLVFDVPVLQFCIFLVVRKDLSYTIVVVLVLDILSSGV